MRLTPDLNPGYLFLLVFIAGIGTGLVGYWLAGGNVGPVGKSLRVVLVFLLLLGAVAGYLGLACAGVYMR